MGITTFRITGAEGVAFVVASDELKDRLTAMAEANVRARPTVTPLPTNTPSPTNTPMLRWTTYRNTRFEYEIDVAPNWDLMTENYPAGRATFASPDRISTMMLLT